MKLLFDKINRVISSNLFKFYNSNYYWVLLGFILCCALASMTIFLFYGGMSCDSYYYLGVSDLIIEGKIPYKDFALDYTPFTFYLMCIPIYLFGRKTIVVISFLYLIHIANAFLVYKIGCISWKDKRLCTLSAILFLFFSAMFGIEDYILEPHVLLFGLLSILVLRSSYKYGSLFAGILCFMSFYSKQYGLGFFILNIIEILILCRENNKYWKDLISLLAGFIVALIIALLALWIQDVRIIDLLVLSGSNYRRDGIVNGLLLMVLAVILRIPVIIPAIIHLTKQFSRIISNRYIVISILGMGGFFLQTYFRAYPHYLLIALPFIVFLIIESFLLIKKQRYPGLIYGIMFFLVLYSFVLIIKTDKDCVIANKKQVQVHNASVLAKHIPVASENVFFFSTYMYAGNLNRYMPPLLEKYGMSNGFEFSKEKYDLIYEANYLILSNEQYDAFNNECGLKEAINNDFICEKVQLSGGNAIILKRKTTL